MSVKQKYLISRLKLETSVLICYRPTQNSANSCIYSKPHLEKLREEVFKGRRVLAKLEKQAEVVTSHSDKSDLKVSDVKLPVFSGDVMTWSEFWDFLMVSMKMLDMQW